MAEKPKYTPPKEDKLRERLKRIIREEKDSVPVERHDPHKDSENEKEVGGDKK